MVVAAGPVATTVVALVSPPLYTLRMSHRPDGIHPATWKVLRALRAGARLSRNRHFNLFTNPRARRALSVHRYLTSIARDVAQNPDDICVERIPGDHAGYALRIEIPLVRGRRTAYVSAYELALLAEDAPEVAALLHARTIDSEEGEGG